MSSLEKKFLEGTLETSISTLDDLAPLHSSRYNSNIRGHRYSIPSRAIHEGILTAYKAIPNPNNSGSYSWLEVWKTTIEQSLAKLILQEETKAFSEPDGHPSSWDNYLMERIAFVITKLDKQEASKQLWQPILEFGISASDWVTWFIKLWTPYSLHPKASEHGFR